MALKDIKEYSAEEVGMWLTAQGLGDDAPQFVEEGVDGDLLLSLTVDDMKADLGMSGIHAKKVLKNIEFSKGLTAAASGGGEETEALKEELETITEHKESLEQKLQELEDAIKVRDDEIAKLMSDMEAMKVENNQTVASEAPAPPRAPTPEPAPEPAPAHRAAPAPAPAPRRRRGVLGGAATGAAGGAAKGAIAGAILPGMDASDGAKAGAAVGATRGGLRGLRGRRRG